ncbi:MAG: sulfite exporter TauE/SafE family protein [Verrucomicrobiota bacterium]|nr:sulfite exporter TauE/SafE family protein [Verrucomicrobiota bacterium]
MGVPIGVYFLEQTSENFLFHLLGFLMLLIAAREFFFTKEQTNIPHGLTVPLGLFSGSLSGAFNLGGIPTAAYAYAHPWSQGQIMAFLQVVITSSCLIRLICYSQVGYFREFSWRQGALLAIPLYAAIWLGHFSMKRIPPKKMRQGIFIFIGVTGFYYLFWHGAK